jgi:hypothetical protein
MFAPLARLILVIAVGASLSGCAVMAVGGAAVGVAGAAVDVTGKVVGATAKGVGAAAGAVIPLNEREPSRQ